MHTFTLQTQCVCQILLSTVAVCVPIHQLSPHLWLPIAPFLNNHTTDTNRYEGSLDDFVTDWLDGTIAFGKWTDHLKSWYVCQAALQNSAPPWQLVVDARAGDMLLI